jgi:hypothetical protein
VRGDGDGVSEGGKVEGNEWEWWKECWAINQFEERICANYVAESEILEMRVVRLAMLCSSTNTH